MLSKNLRDELLTIANYVKDDLEDNFPLQVEIFASKFQTDIELQVYTGVSDHIDRLYLGSFMLNHHSSKGFKIVPLIEEAGKVRQGISPISSSTLLNKIEVVLIRSLVEYSNDSSSGYSEEMYQNWIKDRFHLDIKNDLIREVIEPTTQFDPGGVILVFRKKGNTTSYGHDTVCFSKCTMSRGQFVSENYVG